MRNKFQNLSLQGKISFIYILANVFVLIINIILLSEINNMSQQLEAIYQDNLHLNELSEALSNVQNSMTEYLNVKTSDSLENVYRSEQKYTELVRELNNDITSSGYERMERNIRHMSENYLETVDQTIEAKRGRNVEKYRVRYENATELYHNIDTYISSLNIEKFKSNSANYSQLSTTFRLFGTVSTVVLILVMVGNIIIIIRLTSTVIKPLKMLAVSAGEVADGNFDTELKDPDSRDEIGVLTIAFNQMVKSLRSYIEQVRLNVETERAMKEKELLMEAEVKDAQLKYLQAQINPHFLFNTLNAGAQLAMMEGADRTYDYVQNMSEFFRYNVKKGNETVTLKEEIELVDSYIYILNVRFSGDIHYEKEVDDSLLNVEMPSMILQPIVENCVNHGIREMMGEGKIHLKVSLDRGRASISIRDNGIGISPETIEKILKGTYRDEELPAGSNGIGMNNVISRLKLFTDQEPVMTINSEGPNLGTEVIIYLPMRKPEDENV